MYNAEKVHMDEAERFCAPANGLCGTLAEAYAQVIDQKIAALIIAIARKYGVGDFEGPGINGEAPGRRLLIDPPNVAEAAGFKITVNAGKSGGKDYREIIVTKEETKE